MYLKSIVVICWVFALPFLVAPVASGQDGLDAKVRQARTVWQKHSNRISQLLDVLRSNASACNQLDKDIAERNAEILRLEEELRQELAEMAEGKFCSRCGEIASKIERGGEPFMVHIQKVEGMVIPASPEQLEKARQRGEERIAAVRRALAKSQEEKTTKADALSKALHELTVTIQAYHRTLFDEKTLQESRWAQESGRWEEKLKDLQSQLEATAKQPANEATAVQLRATEAQLQSSLTSTSAAEARARQTATSFNQTVRRDMDALAKEAETIPSGQPLVDGWHIGKSITSHNITYQPRPVWRPQRVTAAQQLKGSSKPAPSIPATKSAADLLKGK